MNSVFADTSAWCALFNARDDHHPKASSDWRRLLETKKCLVTSDYIFDETITLLRRRVGYAVSREVGEKMLKSSFLEFIALTPDDFQRAWDFYKKYHDHPLSFTDCASLSLMEGHRIPQVWTFDGDFHKVGMAIF